MWLYTNTFHSKLLFATFFSSSLTKLYLCRPAYIPYAVSKNKKFVLIMLWITDLAFTAEKKCKVQSEMRQKCMSDNPMTSFTTPLVFTHLSNRRIFLCSYLHSRFFPTFECICMYWIWLFRIIVTFSLWSVVKKFSFQ